MLNRKIAFLFVFVLISTKTLADCDFKKSDYLNQLDNFSLIERIEVDIAKNKKWTVNYFKAAISNKSFIEDKFKKRYKANINVKYSFGGTCSYPAKVRINGDWRDHLGLKNGSPFPSLDIKLNNGNIANKVRFKLLRPETRNNENEIYFTELLRSLGYIAPLTSKVNVKVGNVTGEMLFQEKSEKELVESLGRRENAMFEGDESLLVGYKNFAPFEKTKIGLAKLTNPKWASKGSSSFEISLNAFQRLQSMYISQNINGNHDATDYDFYSQNQEYIKKLKIYDTLIFAANAYHGNRLHNRKFIWNSFLNSFETIYYDGMVDTGNLITKLKHTKDDSFLYFLKNISLDDIENTIKKIKGLEKNVYLATLVKRGLKESIANDGLTFLDNITKNINSILSLKQKEKTLLLPHKSLSDSIKNYVENVFKENEKFSVLKILDRDSNLFNVEICDKNHCSYETINSKTLIQIMSRKGKIVPIETFLIPIEDYQNNFADNNIKVIDLNEFEIEHTKTSNVSIDNNSKTITLIPSSIKDWFLIKNGKIEDYKIIMKRIDDKLTFNINSEQRFNPYGLTGCLNFYNVYLQGVNISAEKSWCEDSVNIVNSSGSINKIEVFDAFADALDIDFSDVKISSLKIRNAGNDCYDVSSGKYLLKNAHLTNCNDKAFSIGEKSEFRISNAFVEQSNLGIAVKDSSQAHIENLNLNETKSCANIYKKKQEFDGGIIFLKTHNCDQDKIAYDYESKVVFIK